MSGFGDGGWRADPEAVRARRAAMNERGRQVRTMLTIRWVLVALTGLLGAAIIAAGGWLIGGLLLALAAMRIVMLTGIERRRRAWQARYGRGPNPPGSGAPGAPIDV